MGLGAGWNSGQRDDSEISHFPYSVGKVSFYPLLLLTHIVRKNNTTEQGKKR